MCNNLLEATAETLRGIFGAICFCACLGFILAIVGLAMLTSENTRDERIAEYNDAVTNYDDGDGPRLRRTEASLTPRNGSADATFDRTDVAIAVRGNCDGVTSDARSVVFTSPTPVHVVHRATTITLRVAAPSAVTSTIVLPSHPIEERRAPARCPSSSQNRSSSRCYTADMATLCERTHLDCAQWVAPPSFATWCDAGDSCGECVWNEQPASLCARLRWSASGWTRAPGSCSYDRAAREFADPVRCPGYSSVTGRHDSAVPVAVTLRSQEDPWLELMTLTDGSADFGLTEAQQRATGAALLVVGVLIIAGFVAAAVFVRRRVLGGNRDGNDRRTFGQRLGFGGSPHAAAPQPSYATGPGPLQQPLLLAPAPTQAPPHGPYPPQSMPPQPSQQPYAFPGPPPPPQHPAFAHHQQPPPNASWAPQQHSQQQQHPPLPEALGYRAPPTMPMALGSSPDAAGGKTGGFADATWQRGSLVDAPAPAAQQEPRQQQAACRNPLATAADASKGAAPSDSGADGRGPHGGLLASGPYADFLRPRPAAQSPPASRPSSPPPSSELTPQSQAQQNAAAPRPRSPPPTAARPTPASPRPLQPSEAATPPRQPEQERHSVLTAPSPITPEPRDSGAVSPLSNEPRKPSSPAPAPAAAAAPPSAAPDPLAPDDGIAKFAAAPPGRAAQGPRLVHVHGSIRNVQTTDVAPTAASLNEGDVFILVTDAAIFVFQGASCSPGERAAASRLAAQLEAERPTAELHVVSSADAPAAFWAALGGKAPVRGA